VKRLINYNKDHGTIAMKKDVTTEKPNLLGQNGKQVMW
jgi:hypothetical protein